MSNFSATGGEPYERTLIVEFIRSDIKPRRVVGGLRLGAPLTVVRAGRNIELDVYVWILELQQAPLARSAERLCRILPSS